MKEYESRLKRDELDSLFQAILQLNTVTECYQFFEDALTIPELLSVAQRWEVARSLDQGNTYADIAERLGASTATISRVNRALSYGAGGYRLLLDRCKQSANAAEKE